MARANLTRIIGFNSGTICKQPFPIAPRTVKFGRGAGSTQQGGHVKICRMTLLLLAAAGLVSFSGRAQAQTLADPGEVSTTPAATPRAEASLTYTRPTEATKLRNYSFDAFGPYPITIAAMAAGINQSSNAPPEWGQGGAGYGRRLGSDFGIAVVGTTTRYGLAEVFREDTLYYRCLCKGVFPRLGHAVISTVTGRRGPEGHRVFSFSALAAPYAGTLAAVYGWYPGRFGAKDGLRMGNYGLLAYMSSNIGMEFFYSGPHSLLSRIHLTNPRGAPAQGPNR